MAQKSSQDIHTPNFIDRQRFALEAKGEVYGFPPHLLPAPPACELSAATSLMFYETPYYSFLLIISLPRNSKKIAVTGLTIIGFTKPNML